MPLEISEIGVHLAVGAAGSAAPAAAGGDDDHAPPSVNTEQIVERCVAEVLRVLKQREAR